MHERTKTKSSSQKDRQKMIGDVISECVAQFNDFFDENPELKSSKVTAELSANDGSVK